MKNILLISIALMSLSACSKPVTSWQQPGVSADKWSQDRAECYSWSRRQAEQEIADRPPSHTQEATDTGFREFMSGYDTKRSQQSWMETCLRRRGYTPVEAKPEAK